MNFYSHNAFGGSYARPGKQGALIFGEDSSFEAAKNAFSNAIESCDAIVVGAGSGLSTAAGFTYSGQRFDQYFADFRDAYGITDMYSGGFHPFPDYETYWAWWSRHILINRYDVGAGQPAAASRGQRALRHHHERRPPVPGCRLQKGAPLLHAGGLWTDPMRAELLRGSP